ncbi:unnamed protein product [Calypogeia fissa]
MEEKSFGIQLGTVGAFDALLNLSLGFNSVGFFQLTKLAKIPCTVLLETVFLRKKFGWSVQMSLILLLVGVSIAAVTDLQLNAIGSVLSIKASKYRPHSCCISQVLTRLYPFLIGPSLDGALTKQNMFAFSYTMKVLFFITLSCLISVSVNFSTFLVIGKTSPLTYQVLGQLKTCLILAFGYVLLRNPFSWGNIFGIAVAVVGMVFYSYVCMVESQQRKVEAGRAVQDLKESDSDPLRAEQT